MRLRRPVARLAFGVALAAFLGGGPWLDGEGVGQASAARRRLKPAVIQVYHGLGTTRRAVIWGRVLVDKHDRAPGVRESRWRKVKRTLRALNSSEIPYASLVISVAGRHLPVKADKEGLFRLEIPGPLRTGRHPVTATLLGLRRFRVEPGLLLVWPSRPGVVVISDIDDTVLRTGVGNKLKMAYRILTTNARDLKSYPHAAALYRVWSQRGYALAFVSGSPINLHLRLRRFLALQRFPPAPLLLKDFGLSGRHGLSAKQMAYKLDHLKELLTLLPGYRLLLVGDSGEQDPEIYAALRRRHPKRVVAILIHRVTKESPQATRFAGQILFDDYRSLARSLKTKGLLTPAELRAVAGSP